MLLLVTLTLTALLGMAALAIDLGSFFQAQRQAQAAADAGALAGADDLSTNPNAATTDAQSLATTNDPTAWTPIVTEPTMTSVKVTVNAASPSFFGKFLGLAQGNVSASATAAISNNSVPCATAGNVCFAIFAMDRSCSDNAVTINAGNIHITGGIHSNAGASLNGANSDSYGPTTYGTGCPAPSPGNATYVSGPTAEAPILTWPIDYSTIYPPCSGSSCTGPGGTPSYCTQAAASYSFTSGPVTGNIYCAYGTGAPSDPSTYNGAVSFSTPFGSSGTPIASSFIAGTIYSITAQQYLEPYNYPSNKMLFYAAAADPGVAPGAAVYLGGGSETWIGDIFAPQGTISISAGGASTNFLEGYKVTINAGNMTGDGPLDSGTTSTTASTSSLIQ